MTSYTNVPQRSVELLIDASPAEVWALVSDPTLPIEFSEELNDAAWGEHTSGVPGVGSIIIGHNSHGEAKWTSTSRVTDWEPERRFTWEVGDNPDNPSSSWQFLLEPVGKQTRLRQRVTLGPGGSPISDEIHAHPEREEEILDHRLTFQAESMMRTLQAVKAKLEG